MALDPAPEDITRLQRCVNDLMAVLTLPVAWRGCEVVGIVEAFLDGLVATLRLDFAYARLSDATAGTPIELVRSDRRDATPPAVGRALRALTAGDVPTGPLLIPNPLGEEEGRGDVTIASLRLGVGEDDRLIVGSARPDFPTGFETLVLRVAANEAVIGLHEARLLSEQRRSSKDASSSGPSS
jgi:hypothetical protein